MSIGGKEGDIIFKVRDYGDLIWMYLMATAFSFFLFAIFQVDRIFLFSSLFQPIILGCFYWLIVKRQFFRFYNLTFKSKELEINYLFGGHTIIPFEKITQITYLDVENALFTEGKRHVRNCQFFFDNKVVIRDLGTLGEEESSLIEIKRVVRFWKNEGFEIKEKTVDYYNSKKWVLPKDSPIDVNNNLRVYKRFVTKYD
jgi:hypothetical protein